jgi:hypothetical protein
MNNFSTVHAILIQISSIGAAWRRNSKISTKSPLFRTRGHFIGKTPPMGISSQNTLLNNYILTRSTDSHLQYTDEFGATSKTQEVIQNFQTSFQGSNQEISKQYPID